MLGASTEPSRHINEAKQNASQLQWFEPCQGGHTESSPVHFMVITWSSFSFCFSVVLLEPLKIRSCQKKIVKGTNGNIISEMDPGYIFVAQEGERSDYIEQDGHSRGTTAIFLRLSAARLHVHKQHSHVQIHTHTHTYFNSNINLIILSCLDPAFHTPNPSRKPSQ